MLPTLCVQAHLRHSRMLLSHPQGPTGTWERGWRSLRQCVEVCALSPRSCVQACMSRRCVLNVCMGVGAGACLLLWVSACDCTCK